ncbi:hypothetical protein CPB83DRAFT_849693 [Crepidotus variabilis]|uniref:Secreted protein n=1 Tax=Crepidotus variabilis TaxID=179855 RepID=A0A9P6ELU5_9AGAR|nr:hypothetical protein CPB83DRAFT_849693 [Crepidotus variabilis]
MMWFRSFLPLSFVCFSALPVLSLNVPILSEYADLLQRCEEGGANAYVGVHYQGDTGYQTFNYGQCYPYQIGKDLAKMAVFCKSVTCYSNPDPDCTGGATPPVGVPLPKYATLINAADFVQLLGQGATCQPNGIPV